MDFLSNDLEEYIIEDKVKNKNRKCEHGRDKYRCKECGGSGSCEHKHDKRLWRAASPGHPPGYLTGSGLVADIGPLLPSQGCRLPSPDRGMRYDTRTSSPNRKGRRTLPGDTEEERMWDQLVCPPHPQSFIENLLNLAK